MSKEIDNPCPSCEATDIGDLIPAEIADLYSGTHWRKHIGISDRMADRVTHWQCWQCGHRWERK